MLLIYIFRLQLIFSQVNITKPQKGYSVIRSSTLGEAFQTIVSLVVQLTYDDDGSKKRGFSLLAHDGFFVRLQDQLVARKSQSYIISIWPTHYCLVIHEYKLDRSPRIKYYFGQEHIHILISTMLLQTENSPSRRATVLQTMARVLLSFFTSCRPSSMGYTDPKFRDEGMVGSCILSQAHCNLITSGYQYPKLKDIRVFRKGYMEYEITIKLSNFKVRFMRNSLVADIVTQALCRAQSRPLKRTYS